MSNASRLAILLLVLLLACRNTSGPVWKWTLESRSYAQPLIDKGKVYVVSQAGEVICGNLSNGDRSWTVKMSGPILAEPAIREEKIYGATENGWVFSLAASDGKVLWQTRLEDDGVAAPLSFKDDVLLVPSVNGTLYALASTNGTILWSVPGNRKYNCAAVFENGRIYIGGWAPDFLCLNPDGSVNWRFRAAQIIAEDALVARNTVYFAAHDHFVYALDASSGRLIWRYPAQQPTRPFLIGKELLFATGRDFVVLRPEDGRFLRRFSLPTQIVRLFWIENRLFYATQDTKIMELDTIHQTTRPFLQPTFRIFKLNGALPWIIASDEQYGIYGFRLP